MSVPFWLKNFATRLLEQGENLKTPLDELNGNDHKNRGKLLRILYRRVGIDVELSH